jgi:hypothetical protein
MPQGRPWFALAVLAAFAGPAAAQTAPNAAPAGGCDPCPPSCAAAPRVKVILPPPEVVFCPQAPRCGGAFHHAAPCPAPCAPCAAPAVTATAPAAPGGGMMNFNMTYQMPYMTYQMTPVMMGSAFGGMGLSGGMFGMGGVGMGGLGVSALQPAGVNVGMGGLQMALSGSALAAALGIRPAGGLAGGGAAAAELQALRALLGRAAGAGAGAAEGDVETQMRRLAANINDITRRIDSELANVQQMRAEMNSGTMAIERLSTRLKELEARMDAIKPVKKNGSD